MPRYKLTLEYDGSPFSGWQKTPGQPSIQAALEEAFFRFSAETVKVITAGRTDAGVHARAQVVHADLVAEHDPFRVMNALNFFLRNGHTQPICVLNVEQVSGDFHARFSAKARHYRYRILNRRSPPALEAGRVWHIALPLDITAMHTAAQVLVGHHDFTSFRASECQGKSPIKTLDRLDVMKNDEEVHIEASSRSFLHHQVRNMVGTLTQVGLGRWNTKDVKTALEARDRKAGGPTAPAQGLYLMKVDY